MSFLDSSVSGSNPTTIPILEGLNQRMNDLRPKQASYPRETLHVAPPPIITNVKASDLLKQQLLSVPALAAVLGGTSSRSTARPQPAPPLRFHRFFDDFASETTQKSTQQKASEAATMTDKDTETEKRYDGQIHSNPHKKNHHFLDDFASETTQKSTPQKASEAETVTGKDTETEKKYDGRIHSNPHKKNRRFLDDFAFETTQKSTPQKASEAVTDKDAETEKKYDGRIHSNPHKKNGPYTCPKCKGVFDTSQRFASHVSSIHYKFESKGERKKRLTARYYKRNPRVEWINGKPTIVWGNNNNSVVVPPPPRVLPKTECVFEELLPLIGFGKPIPPPGYGKPIPPPSGYGKPIPSPIGFGKPIPPPSGYGKPIPPPIGFGKPIPPPPGFGKPIPPPPGFENVNYAIPGFHLPFRFHQKLTDAAPRGVQIKLDIQ